MTSALIEDLPKSLEKIVSSVLSSDEEVIVKLKGVEKEALVCTDRRWFIVKSGFGTGRFFSSDVFQIPYSKVSSVEVKQGLFSGYFQISAGGVQNTEKYRMTTDPNFDVNKAPNCVRINSKKQSKLFNEAGAIILSRAETNAP